MTINSPTATLDANSNDKSLFQQKSVVHSAIGQCHSTKHESILILEITKNQFIPPSDTNSNKKATNNEQPPRLSTQHDIIPPQQVTTKLYSCPKCPQNFSRPHNLKSHLATHSTDRPFQCEQCDAHFRRQHDLKRHQKLHTGERPFVCQVCSRSFARSDALNRHQRVDGDIRCSMAQRHCIIPFNVAPLQQTISSSTTNTRKSPSSASMTFSFPTQSSASKSRPPQQIRQGPAESTYSLPSPSSPPSPSFPSPSSSSESGLPPMPLLPSPSTLSALPLSSNPNLSPLYNIPTSNTANTALTTIGSQYHHNHDQQPLITVVPPSPSFVSSHFSRQKTLPAPIAPSIHIPPITSEPTSPYRYSHWKDQEIIRLKQEHERQMDRLANEVHDLEVENKVLRSLVLQTNRQQLQSRPESYIFGNGGGDGKKRSRQPSLDISRAQQDTTFTKKSRHSI